MKKDIIERIIELLRDDEVLRQAVLRYIEARTEAYKELAEWRKRR